MEALELSFDLILSSPYLRARQTAEIIAEALRARKRLELTESLTPGGSMKQLVEWLNHLEPPPENVLLVGHEPYLSGLISLLVSGEATLRRGDEEGRTVRALDRVAKPGRCAALEWLLTPKQMGLMGYDSRSRRQEAQSRESSRSLFLTLQNCPRARESGLL